MMDMGYEYSSTYWSGRVGTEYESNRSKNSTVMKPDWKDGSERRIDHGSCISRYSKYNLSSASLSLSTLTYYNVLGREREKVCKGSSAGPPVARCTLSVLLVSVLLHDLFGFEPQILRAGRPRWRHRSPFAAL